MWNQHRSELDELETENLQYTATAKHRSRGDSPAKYHQTTSDGFYIGDEIFKVPTSKAGRKLVRQFLKDIAQCAGFRERPMYHRAAKPYVPSNELNLLKDVQNTRKPMSVETPRREVFTQPQKKRRQSPRMSYPDRVIQCLDAAIKFSDEMRAFKEDLKVQCRDVSMGLIVDEKVVAKDKAKVKEEDAADAEVTEPTIEDSAILKECRQLSAAAKFRNTE